MLPGLGLGTVPYSKVRLCGAMREISPTFGGALFAAGFVVIFAYLLDDGARLMDMVLTLFNRANDALATALDLVWNSVARFL